MHPHVLERAIALVRHPLRYDNLTTARHERDDPLDEQRRILRLDPELDLVAAVGMPWRSSQPTGASTPRRGRSGGRRDGSRALRPRGAGPASLPHSVSSHASAEPFRGTVGATPAEPPGGLPEHVDARPEVLDCVDVGASIGQQRHPDPVVGEHHGAVDAVEQLLRGSCPAQRGPAATKVAGRPGNSRARRRSTRSSRWPTTGWASVAVHARVPGADRGSDGTDHVNGPQRPGCGLESVEDRLLETRHERLALVEERGDGGATFDDGVVRAEEPFGIEPTERRAALPVVGWIPICRRERGLPGRVRNGTGHHRVGDDRRAGELVDDGEVALRVPGRVEDGQAPVDRGRCARAGR